MPNPKIAEAGAATRFTSENRPRGGRPKGSRDKLNATFLADLQEAWEAKGKAAIEKLAENDAATFVRVVAGLQPKEVQVSHTPEADLTDAEIEEAYTALLARVAAKKATPDAKVH